MSMVQKNKQVTVSFPKSLLVPIQKFLESEVIRWKKTEKNMKKNDPFSDNNRLAQNSVEEDVDEQVGHFETEVKVSFIKKQLVQLRKALTMIKFGKYGICEKCGKMIDTDRLAVKPEVTVCIKCAQEQE
ncbi:MAG: TraR/DksA C4-type zinc finger protein [Microgenomates group bacterium]